ncbi:threonine/serine exporter family protein [Enterococcus bulliens]|uniref:threonine/serine exporter family protein n=1 Tax=uncultured Enterococcus sp. TaxID=167972 RepID=UPI0025FF2176|nr:threonine/serine exporter family protein [uncultured Enterococcus sp.]
MIYWLIQIAFSYFCTVGFGVLTNVPRRALNGCGITGMIGWCVFLLMRQNDFGIGSSNFIAAFLIGIFSIYFSRYKKMPVIIFSIPSIVPLVPGGPAYQAVREFVLGNSSNGFQYVVIVILTSGAIAAAFMLTSLVENIVLQWQQKYKNPSKGRG